MLNKKINEVMIRGLSCVIICSLLIISCDAASEEGQGDPVPSLETDHAAEDRLTQLEHLQTLLEELLRLEQGAVLSQHDVTEDEPQSF